MSRDSGRTRVRRKVGALAQLPWRAVTHGIGPVAILGADQVEAVHDASMRILETIGIEFLNTCALDRFARASATVDRATGRVRLDRGQVAELVAKAPSVFTVHGRTAERDVVLGGDRMLFGSVAGPPNCIDLDRGRRSGTMQDMTDALRVIQGLTIVHVVGGAPVAPLDEPLATRHLDMVRAFLTLTDRVFHAWPLERFRVRDALDMLGLALGLDRDGVAAAPRLLGTVNADSPLRYDGPTIDGMLELVEAGQVAIVTPFTVAGGMAPASLAGALAQQNAEALAAIALAQIVRAGAPVVYGGFTAAVDMRSGAPAFGTPETVKAAFASGQMARRYGLPFRSSGVNSANAVDAQAAYESEMALWGAVLGHANYVGHAAGWLQGGQAMSFEKLIVDAEMLQMISEVQRPVDTATDELGVEAMREVGPGGHFFGAQHTLARYETAFYAPMVSDWRNYETWREAGSEDTATRANRIWKELLARSEPPPMDAAVAEAIAAFVARRKREIALAVA